MTVNKPKHRKYELPIKNYEMNANMVGIVRELSSLDEQEKC